MRLEANESKPVYVRILPFEKVRNSGLVQDFVFWGSVVAQDNESACLYPHTESYQQSQCGKIVSPSSLQI